MRQVRGLGQIIQLRLARVHQHVIGVIVAVPAEVDAWLGHRGLTSRGNVLEDQYRVALGGGFIGAGGDHAVTMRVLELEVWPGLGLRI